ncbi:MAG: hypothetical protein K2X55_07910 [Burkholderiaceae bacterium]|nr:hypothetical protein [Burkholderiaceae bacterium]
MSDSSVIGVADLPLPFEPCVADAARQRLLTERHLLPALPLVHAFFFALRAYVDRTLQPAQPVKLGKPYPLGQCLEISQAVLRQLAPECVAVVPLTGDEAAGLAAFNAFRQAGGMLRLVWGDLRGEFFQNAFQLGSLYLDVSNDTVNPAKPKVEILPFEQARLAAVADFRHFARLAARYWKHRVYPNHILPALAPYCPLIHLAPDGTLSLKDCSEYMVGMARAGRFAASEAVLADPPMPPWLFQYLAQALDGAPFPLPVSAQEGRAMALQTCADYRAQGRHAEPRHAAQLATVVHDANHRLVQVCGARPCIPPPDPLSVSIESVPAMQTVEKVTINGIDYLYAELSETARQQVDMVRAIDGKLADLQRDVAINQKARAAYIEALVQALPVQAR